MDVSSMTPHDYWRDGHGLGNITPKGKKWPEGSEFGEFLADIFSDQSVCEFGCGTGRLAQCFPNESYFGFDICEDAIDLAQRDNPDHAFFVDTGNSLGFPGEAVLAHTVLLHIPDDKLDDVIKRFFLQSRVVVSEILGRHWRREGNPPVFNREASDYDALFARHGYSRQMTYEHAYPHYRGIAALTLLDYGLTSKPGGDL